MKRSHVYDSVKLSVKDPLGLGRHEADECWCVSLERGFIHPSGHIFRGREHITLGKWYHPTNTGYPMNRDHAREHVLSLVQVWNYSFQHITFDTLPKIPMIRRLLERTAAEGASLKILVMNGLQKSLVNRFLGLPDSAYIIAAPRTAYVTARAYYINFVNTAGHNSREELEMGSSGYGTIAGLLGGEGEGGEKCGGKDGGTERDGGELDTVCYISRRGANKRVLHPNDENQLVLALSEWSRNRGLKFHLAVNPGSPEQIQPVLQCAAILVTVHGGALGNMIWCAPGTRVIEVIPRAKLRERPCFYYLANALGLSYSYVEPTQFDFDNGRIPIRADARAVVAGCERAIADLGQGDKE
jgi:hypothetical protein